MTNIAFSNIIQQKYIAKCNKYLVKIGIINEPAREIWMTEKQAIQLNNIFDNTPNGWSNKDITVYGVFDGDFYRYAIYERHKQKRLFAIPREQDLSDLQDD